jgi:CheY-like chemotaxis protein
MVDPSKNPKKADRPAPVILCVDDERPALSMRSAILTGAGYTVLSASNSHQALELFDKNHVDLVITDHLLVGATGIQLARRIQETRPDLPVIILSGILDKPDDADEGYFFLSKAAGPTEMLSQVGRLLKL